MVHRGTGRGGAHDAWPAGPARERHQPLPGTGAPAARLTRGAVAPKPGYEAVFEHSFTWVAAWANEELVGFVNVAWDGDVHFFLLDLTVHPEYQHRGIGQRLVEEAIDACRGHGEWLHVDADDPLMADFYERRCGFVRTPAGLFDLSAR
ncbi:MAG: GNAT family N-acetyltransferase [Candidatus Limnocylindria bacterium]